MNNTTLTLIRRLRQPVVYSIIGVINTVVHLCVFVAVVRIGHTQAFSNLCAFLVAVTVSYVLNARFTFKTRPKISQYCRMVVSMAVISWLFGYVGDTYKLEPVLTFVIYCIINPILGFIISKYFIFTK